MERCLVLDRSVAVDAVSALGLRLKIPLRAWTGPERSAAQARLAAQLQVRSLDANLFSGGELSANSIANPAKRDLELFLACDRLGDEATDDDSSQVSGGLDLVEDGGSPRGAYLHRIAISDEHADRNAVCVAIRRHEAGESRECFVERGCVDIRKPLSDSLVSS